MNEPKKVKREIRCSPDFRLQLIDLAYMTGFLKKKKLTDEHREFIDVDVMELDDLTRSVSLERIQGVSSLLACVINKKAIIIDGADKSDMREIEKKFNKANSNISQLQTLTEGVIFEFKGSNYDLEKRFFEFIHAKSELGEQVNLLLKIKTLHTITSGEIYDCKIRFAHGQDVRGTYSERMFPTFDKPTNQKIIDMGMELKPAFRKLIRDAELKKEGAQINHPLILNALEIYQQLNVDLTEVNRLNLEGKDFYPVLFNALNKRKNECKALTELLKKENKKQRAT
ncbi:hypothetical protein AO073_01555 [Pseudomonas syringae ICMP 11293]|uniref:hypothetical protein n=1 Tax=Pseudomonas syringae TaxID=317 RepID=UPI00073081CD|nr:hypothetical protein [Pseudomonas syringae]KTB91587.1 hypothetical protein AO073_01555 [Pseudomonas syringae ICMP 11293]